MILKNRFARKYIRQVRSMLPGTVGKKNIILNKVREEVFAYLEENPQATDKDLQQRFGTPEDIASSYIETMGTPEIMEKFRIRKWILFSIATLLIFIALVWSAVVIYAVIENERDDFGRIEVVIEDA